MTAKTNRRRKGDPISGWVNLDKPYDFGSTPSVGRVRRIFNAQKAGHAGTLDPLATGVLPIALGEATKTVPFMMDAKKSYDVTIIWGEHRDTCDAQGDVVETSDHRPNLSDIQAALPAFIGDIAQTPPRFSAIKIDGKRAYDLARAGETVEMKSRPVRIDAIEIMGHGADTLTLAVDCGKGTYIRSLARDLAWALGTCGYVGALRRTRVGPFTVEDAFSLDALEKLHYEDGVLESLRPVETVLDDIPVLAVTDKDADDLRQGRAIVLPPSFTLGVNADNPQRLLVMNGEKAVALCDVRGSLAAPKRVFNL